MNTCISLKCPYIDICKNYNHCVDRGEQCKTRKRITELAKREIIDERLNPHVIYDEVKRDEERVGI